MIFYLIPPRVRIDLRSLNECCFSRFKFFLEKADSRDYDTVIEKLIPGTKMDQIGHFMLRCFCTYHPEAKDFIIRQEINLFFYRLKTLSWNDWRKSCKLILKQIPQLQNYKVFNSMKRSSERPVFGELLWSALSSICETLLDHTVGRHLNTECDSNCNKYCNKGTTNWNLVFETILNFTVPFQMCLSLVRDRSVPLENGFALVPCSMWNFLLAELFRHHYEFGLTMICNTILPYLNSDVRWTIAFSQLSNTYDSFKQLKPLTFETRLSARQIDDEKVYFPPCMAHLLKMLRTQHRLSHQWRYNFSLFLKDIGLNVNESIEFWKTEYSKSCTAGSSCTHSWQANHRKYIYSIRHLYGLEGSRLQKKSKSCQQYQDMSLGMREEGGCPFVHFDEANLMASLSKEVTQKADVISEILRLKAINKPCEACDIYRAAHMKIIQKDEPLSKFSSPLTYYRSLKLCSDHLLDW